MSAGAEPFDREELMERLEGDTELLVAIVDIFLGRLPITLSEIGEAVRSRDSERLAESAHRLKGSSANFSAGPVYETCARLEEMARSDSWSGADEAVESLNAASKELETALEAIAREARTGRLESGR